MKSEWLHEDRAHTIPAHVQVALDGPRITLTARLAGQFSRRVMDTEETATRKALAALGWSSPERTQELLSALLRINEEVWPLVHHLTGRQTLREFMRTLPEIINGGPLED